MRYAAEISLAGLLRQVSTAVNAAGRVGARSSFHLAAAPFRCDVGRRTFSSPAGSVIREVKMILSSVKANSNKFWTVQLGADHSLTVVFGRVGTNGATKTWSFSDAAQAKREMESRIAEKKKTGYMEARILADVGGAGAGGKATVRALAGSGGAGFSDMLAVIAEQQLCAPADESAAADAADGGVEPDSDTEASKGGSSSTSTGSKTAGSASAPSSSVPSSASSSAAAAGASVTSPAPASAPAAADASAAGASSTSAASSAAADAAKQRSLVSSLVRRLVEANTHDILRQTSLSFDAAAGSFRTPLGIVTQDAVDEARGLLSQLGDIVAARTTGQGQTSGASAAPAAAAAVTTNTAGTAVAATDDSAWPPLLERYLMLIPRDVGRHRPSLDRLFPDLAAVRAQNGVLDALEASIKAVTASIAARTAASDSAAAGPVPLPKLFRARLSPVPETGDSFAYIKAKFAAGINTSHAAARSNLGLHALYSVRIDAMHEAFESRGRPVGNLRRLWHGTRPSNVLSILQSGMVVPASTSAHVTGRLYGDGLYFASQSTKSLNYSIGAAPGQSRAASSSRSASDGAVFMFLCRVALGKPYIPGYPGRYPVAGFDSTWAKGRQSPGVINDEFIVYDTAQANPLMLCEFRPQ